MMRSPGCVIDVQLAKGRDVVEARIGARIGDHDQAVAYKDSAAIGHGLRDRPNYPGAVL